MRGWCTRCKKGSVVTVGNTDGGLNVRARPSIDAQILTTLPDGAKVVIAEDVPVPGSGYTWHSTFLYRQIDYAFINYGRVWLANEYLLDDIPSVKIIDPPPTRQVQDGLTCSPTAFVYASAVLGG